MSRFLQVRIEFPASEDQGDLTSQVLSDSVRSVFLGAGISEYAVSAGVEEVRLEEATPLGVDPGTAAVLVALIGLSIELIKFGFDLEKRDKELAIEERKLLQEFVNRVLLIQLMERHNIHPTTVVVQIEER